jgi:hypothetical protein
VNETRLRDVYAEVMARSEAPDRRACVTPEQISALVERQSSEAERLALLDHVMSCRACLKEFELLRAIRAAAPRARRSYRVLAIAATVFLMAGATLVWSTVLRDGQPTDIPRSVSAQLTLVSPVEGATVSAPVRFVWEPVAGASDYEVQVFDAEGIVVFSSTITATTVPLEMEASLAAGEYRWLVLAEMQDGGQVRAAARRFQVQAR